MAVIKPAKLRIHEIDGFEKNKRKKHESERRSLVALLDNFNFSWCTDKSPIYKSHETQILSLNKNQGGDHLVTTKLIRY